MSDIPKIYRRKVIELRKPNGSIQYLLTLPKEYAEKLKNRSIHELLVIFNYGLGAFPKDNMTERALLAFMMKHSDIQELFARERRSNQPEGTWKPYTKRLPTKELEGTGKKNDQ
jgi:hypothetical protein